MNKRTIIVNVFSSSDIEKKCTLWELALALTNTGLNVELLDGGYSGLPKQDLTDSTLKMLFERQHALLGVEQKTADVIICSCPLLLFKMHLSEPDVKNRIDDAVLQYDNFNVYLKREQEDIQGLKVKSILLQDEVYGEYDRKSVPVLAMNIRSAFDRIRESKERKMSLVSRGHQNYTDLQKILNRYSTEAADARSIVTMLQDRNIAEIKEVEVDTYKIYYKNIRATFRKCGNMDMGILSNDYCAFENGESDTDGHKYDYKQQIAYRKQLLQREWNQDQEGREKMDNKQNEVIIFIDEDTLSQTELVEENEDGAENKGI